MTSDGAPKGRISLTFKDWLLEIQRYRAAVREAAKVLDLQEELEAARAELAAACAEIDRLRGVLEGCREQLTGDEPSRGAIEAALRLLV